MSEGAAVSELILPWVPEGRLVRVEGRGELFARIHLHPEPDAPVVLLLHGWTASSDLQFVPAYQELAARYTVVGIDHRGHGRGLRSPARFSLDDAADDAAALVGALGLGPVIAVGYSMGGPIAMLLARRHPAVVSGLVVQATAMDWRNTLRDRLLWRVLPIAGSWLRSKGYRRYLNRAVPKVHRGRARRGPPGALVHPVAGQRDVTQRPVRHGRGRPGPGRLRRPAVGGDARRAGRRPRHDERPRRPAAPAVGAGRRARAPRPGQLPADHFAPLSHPQRYTALTIELIEDVRQRASTGSVGSSVVA